MCPAVFGTQFVGAFVKQQADTDYGVRRSTCRRCGAEVLKSSRDTLLDVAASITVDPTPLTVAQRTACIVAGRALYRYEAAGAGAIGLSHWATAGRRMGAPDAFLPEHRCGGRFSTLLPPVRHKVEYGEEPSWVSR